jgi:hypothetical protein
MVQTFIKRSRHKVTVIRLPSYLPLGGRTLHMVVGTSQNRNLDWQRKLVLFVQLCDDASLIARQIFANELDLEGKGYLCWGQNKDNGIVMKHRSKQY